MYNIVAVAVRARARTRGVCNRVLGELARDPDQLKSRSQIQKNSGNMGGFYGKTVWDPKLILGQMAMMQSLYYLSFGTIVLTTNQVLAVLAHSLSNPLLLLRPLVRQAPLSFGQFFSSDIFQESSSVGWSTALAFCLNSLVGYMHSPSTYTEAIMNSTFQIAVTSFCC